MTVHTLAHVAPSTLLVDKNIREAKLTREFVENIREMGVLQPPIVHKSEEGLRVVMGHRRTLAAVEAKLTEIPVLLADTVEEADRLAQQVSENDVREGLTDAERGTAFEQMALLGVTPAQIAKRTGAGDTATVKKALAAKKNATASAALDAGRNFDQALALAEFEDDEYALSQLEEVLEDDPEQFDHVLSQVRIERALDEKIAEIAAPYVERGLTVVDRMGSYADSDVLYLSALEDAEGNQPGEDAADSVHVQLWHIDADPKVWLGIKDWEAKGFKTRYSRSGGTNSGPMTEEQKAARKELIANNKAADAAELVRREWITTLLSRKDAPKGWERFLALAYGVHYRITEDRKADIAAKLLGLKVAENVSHWEPLDTVAKHITEHPSRPATVLLGMVLASFEGSLRRDSWRSPSPSHRFYLNQLATWGYTLSEVEKLITAEPETEED
ncbi:chromosome partitioning protein ParB [Arthrobacter woluwensis]|uniref:ParB/RepB/Spo0J family partition protein n=1 Tax=Arthrobacter woluwensis TaxID=156980 RepID=UPI000D135872|nr:ParB N-terminal domain-containing protein [Arthrobacter woluwensis]PSS43169.1 chromosome partitioning protein ParB [Arthrobacter woluwensis]